MKTPRFNVFNQIHKALRALMFDTVMILQQTDMQDPATAPIVLEQAELLLNIFDAHAHYEDTYILAAAQRFNPAMVEEFESEHVTDLQLTENLRRQISAYQNAIMPWDKYYIGFNLYYALNDFVAFNLKHMNKEEQLLNEMLWKNFTDEQIIDMERRIQQEIPADKVFTYFKWMVKGINDSELHQWLKTVKEEAPEFIFNALVEECRINLPASRFSRVEELV